eukprot:TRINITY_DN2613_c0_g1_i1.p1 TRINITY_DN2613_c0_g1~~TRINITY_DN2613_c0_g1_i1.p1  ORF type:complete len:264 (-),score=24.72 TRINITY_DN2613_c0_g1_i1:448-1239(-)
MSGSNDIWDQIRKEARQESEAEPILANFLNSTILDHCSLERALAFHLAGKLSSSTLLCTQLFTLMTDIYQTDRSIGDAIRADLGAFRERDPACETYLHVFLNYKGFLAVEAHRVAHSLWKGGRKSLALAIQSRVSEVFGVDFHPGATLGRGVFLDHATGVVVGETAVVGNNVTILHHVTLGGTGKQTGDRHPKIRDNVLIGAGVQVLGNIVVGEGTKIGAGSVVLSTIPPYSTAVGSPARIVVPKKNKSFDGYKVENWDDYEI